MRAWSVVVACAACGRLGFDPGSGSGSSVWPLRRALVIDHTKVAGDLADFPIVVEVPDLAPQPLAVTDAADVPLAFEVEPGSPLTVWVKVPALSASADTTLLLYHGNPDGPALASPAAVWSNGFAGVYHFGDGVTLDLADATGVNPGSNSGATAIAGRFAGAAAFDGNSNIAGPATGLDTTPGAFNTVTFWLFYQPTWNRMPVAFRTTTNATYDFWFENDGCEGFNTGSGDNLTTATAGLAGHWIHIAAIFFNGMPAAGSNELYIDGVAQTLGRTCTQTVPNVGKMGTIVYWGGIIGATNYQLVGYLDEARYARGARSAAWIQTEHANQSDPGGFVQIGPDQPW